MLPKHRKNNWSENRPTGIWRHFLDAHPEYLARHYWWAYLWRFGVWFFDHQPIINAILFGQYRALKTQTLDACMTDRPKGRLLQLTCVYGNLTPSLIKSMKGDDLYLMDVADVQLGATREKLNDKGKSRLLTTRMNAEHLAYCDDAFSSVLIFFLLHELPPAAREHTLDETLRVLQPGGRLVITEYAQYPRQHFLCRWWPIRILLLHLEPFLDDFWHQNLFAMLSHHAKTYNKTLRQVDEFHCFSDFYRVCVFEVDKK